MPDWTQGERIDLLRAECVNPIGLYHEGWLPISAATLTEAYYSDSRIQGTATVTDSRAYVPLSMIALIHEAVFPDGEPYKELLGTFFAIRRSSSEENGLQLYEFELKSALYGMMRDEAPDNMTVAEGATAREVYESICTECRRPRIWGPTAVDKRFDSNRIFEEGDTYLSWLHQLANLSGNRLDVDNRGRVTINRYTAPSNRAASIKMEYDSPLLLSNPVRYSDDETDIPGRLILTWDHEYTSSIKDGVYKVDTIVEIEGEEYMFPAGSPRYVEKGETRPMIVYADAEEGSPAHIGRRGYRITSKQDMDDIGDSKSAAMAYAAKLLKQESKKSASWEFSTRWFEVHAGDIVDWKPSENEPYRKILVTTADKNLIDFTIRIEGKEV